MNVTSPHIVDHMTLERDTTESVFSITPRSAHRADAGDILLEAHAAARWARAIVPIIDCPGDPKTIALWGRWIAVSSGALRNWCRTAGVPARRSLIFGRLLRAVHLSDGGRHKPENVLDVVDRRTLVALLRSSGLDASGKLPGSLAEFLEIQTLVRDRDALLETRRLLTERQTRR
jgi:hypothetical protein